MKKIVFLSMIFLLSLFGCSSPSSSGTSSSPVSLDLSGAGSMFLQYGSGTSGGRAAAGDVTELKTVALDSSIETVDFLDSSESAVSVSVSRAMILNDDYMMLSYEYDGTEVVSVCNRSTGALDEITHIPGDWSMVKVYGDMAYYSSGSDLYRLDLSAMSYFDMNGNDYPVGTGHFIVVSNSGTVAALSSGSKYIFLSDGTFVKDQVASPTAIRAYTGLSGNFSTTDMFMLEDESTRELYQVNFHADYIDVAWIELKDSGLYTDPANNQTVTFSTVSQSIARKGEKHPTFANTILTNNDQVFRLFITSGIVTVREYSQSAMMKSYSNPKEADCSGLTLYPKFYYNPDNDTKIIRFDADGLSPVEEVIAAGDITEVTVADDLIFYSESSQTYKYDKVSETTEVYVAEVSDIKAVE